MSKRRTLDHIGRQAAEVLRQVDQMEERKRRAAQGEDEAAVARGEWPPSQSEPAAKEPRDLVLRDLLPLTPPTVATLDPDPTNAREILFAHMVGGLEMLRAMALSPDVPLGIRKDAAALLARVGADALPRRSEHLSASVQRVEVEKVAATLDRLPVEELAKLLGGTTPPPVTVPHPAARRAIPAKTHDPSTVFQTRHRMSVEEKILKVLTERGEQTWKQLRQQCIGTKNWKPLEGVAETVQSMLKRGIIKRHPGTGRQKGRGRFYLPEPKAPAESPGNGRGNGHDNGAE